MANSIQGFLSANSQPQLIDLTDDLPASPNDHMFTVAQMVRREASRSSTATGQQSHGKPGRKSSYASKPSSSSSSLAHRREILSAADFQASLDEESSLTQCHGLDNSISLSEAEDAGITSSRHKRVKKSSRSTFPQFQKLPPEIRNHIYRLLLTTPGIPIELPKLTGPEGRRRDEAWAECTTATKRRRHKALFLEILQASKQIHFEASSIIYGCNVFKFRRNVTQPRFYAPPASAALPTRHLSLLKNIKIAEMSSTAPERGPFQRAAELIQCFCVEGLELEGFELSWFGYSPCTFATTLLTPTNTTPFSSSSFSTATTPKDPEPNPVLPALLALHVSRHFKMLVLGEARMEKTMQLALEEGFAAKGTRKVEIVRPVRADGRE